MFLVDPHDVVPVVQTVIVETPPETDEILERWATAGDDEIGAVVSAGVLLDDPPHAEVPEEVHRREGSHRDGMTEIVCDLLGGATTQGSNHHPRMTTLITYP